MIKGAVLGHGSHLRCCLHRRRGINNISLEFWECPALRKNGYGINDMDFLEILFASLFAQQRLSSRVLYYKHEDEQRCLQATIFLKYVKS